jgi:hypothetical protein
MFCIVMTASSLVASRLASRFRVGDRQIVPAAIESATSVSRSASQTPYRSLYRVGHAVRNPTAATSEVSKLRVSVAVLIRPDTEHT